MSGEDWAKKYAAMDQRLSLKYEQLPRGEQIGKTLPEVESAKEESEQPIRKSAAR